MKTLVSGFHSRRFSRRDLDSSSRGRRISHKKRKSRRKGRGFYGKKSRKMVGGDVKELQIIAEYNPDAKNEAEIGFKITRIEGGGGEPIIYNNCNDTRNELIAKLFPNMKINPSATNAMVSTGVNNGYSSTTTTITIDPVKALDDIEKIFGHKLTKKAIDFFMKEYNNGNIRKLVDGMLPLLGLKKEDEARLKNIIENANTSSNVSKPSTASISNEPVSEGFKDSFMLAMALKMFDENDDAEVVGNASSVGVGVVDKKPVNMATSEKITEYNGATEESNQVINLVKKLIELEKTITYPTQQDPSNNNKEIYKKIDDIKDKISGYIPYNPDNSLNDLNNYNLDIITTAKKIIENKNTLESDFSRNQTFMNQNPDYKNEAMNNINNYTTKLNQLLKKGNTPP